FVDVGVGTRTVRTIDHPEVVRVKTMYKIEEAEDSNGHGQTVLFSAAYDRHIYCLLSGFRAAEGIPVVVIDEKGGALKMLRCAVAYNSNGLAGVPMSLAVDSGLLFVLDSEGVVSIFSL